MLKSVRIVYKKKGDLKFISHLDVNRLMLRLVGRAGLPIWQTEGFHPHPYITFAVPLSLGFESEYDLMDIRITDDSFDASCVADMLNKFAPEGLEFVSSAEPKAKYSEIYSADFSIRFFDAAKGFDIAFNSFLSDGPIIVSKKRKNGNIEDIEVSNKVLYKEVTTDGSDVVVSIRLPAGSAENLNPQLIISSFMKAHPEYDGGCMNVTRGYIYDKSGKVFI